MSKEKLIIKGTDAGFFSMFRGTVGTIYEAKQRGYDVYVEWGQTLYNDDAHGVNAWNYYFENLSDGPAGGLVGVVQNHVILPREYSTRQIMHDTINKYIKVKPDILEEVDALVAPASGSPMLGVHVRMTDKHNCTAHGEPEAGKPLSVELYMKHVDQYLEKHPDATIFLATDDEDCVDAFENKYRDKVIYKDAIRSTGETSVHHHLKGNNYKKGRDVLVDCLALSRCNHLIKGISNVALNAMFFNQDLTCETLNSIYNGDTREDFVQ